ncbi:MAG TPA: DinB family protein [Candidatus Acidoferrum sp.]|nr:DinB family protein [Candidatus Acidoferrum sp.]
MQKRKQTKDPEPWLRGTLTEVPVVPRAAIHALELAKEDLNRWAAQLTNDEVNAQPCGISSVAFHLRHIVGSLDRLLTYAEGGKLTPEQMIFLRGELDSAANRESLFQQLDSAFRHGQARILALATTNLDTKREVGSKRLPTTVGSLLVHVADHTQRHVGQVVTTAKLILAQRA